MMGETAGPFRSAEKDSTMNIHAVTFEQLLEICASLDDLEEMQNLVEALDLLERNVRYLRQRLVGRLREKQGEEEYRKEAERRARRNALRLVTPRGRGSAGTEDG